MKISYRKGFIDRESYVAQYLALALFTIGIVSTLGSDDLLAAFAAGAQLLLPSTFSTDFHIPLGTAISWDGHFNDQTENEVFSSVIDLLLNCACFVYIGAWLPFDQFNRPDLGITPWRLVVLFIVILFVRRIPSLLLLYKWVPEIDGWREALFSGHFGTRSLFGCMGLSLTSFDIRTGRQYTRGERNFMLIFRRWVSAQSSSLL